MGVKYIDERLGDPLNDFQKKLGVSDHITHTTQNAKFGYNRFKGGVAAHARNSPLAVYFLSFFPCAGLQVSPLDRLTPLLAQTKRPGELVL